MSNFLQDTFGLANKVILVTGGAKGLGRMMAESLVRAGAHVLVAARSLEDCEQAAEELSQFGQCTPLSADLSKMEELEELANNVARDHKALHGLLNNSGRSWAAPLETFPADRWDQVMELNVKSPFYLMQKLLPLLKAGATAEDPARVINISSAGGIDADAMNAYPYAASKAALIHLTKGLAKELAEQDILVNSIAPGFFPSRMTRPIQADESMREQILSGIPLGRFGSKEELGALSVYLNCRASAYVTGQVIAIDGGYLIG